MWLLNPFRSFANGHTSQGFTLEATGVGDNVSQGIDIDPATLESGAEENLENIGFHKQSSLPDALTHLH